MKLSIVIPAHNEEENIRECLDSLRETLNAAEEISSFEIIVVEDNSTDRTAEILKQEQQTDPRIRIISRTPPGGFGRAVRSGLDAVTGDVTVVFMADLSDDPQDVIAYYRKIAEGYDCVFGSRFIPGSRVTGYPRFKLFVNRVVNRLVQWMFWTRFNDLTNAFKAYRTDVIRSCGPFRSSHFNLTLEMSLGALSRRYLIVQIPIRWTGRTAGHTNLRLREMGRRYLSTLLKAFCERILISDDLLAERLATACHQNVRQNELEPRVLRLEKELDSLRMERLLQEIASNEELPDMPRKPLACLQTANTRMLLRDEVLSKSRDCRAGVPYKALCGRNRILPWASL